MQRAKSSSMHQNSRPSLLQSLSIQQKTKLGLADPVDSNMAANDHVKTIFRQLGGSDALMIDESQEINRKTSKDSKDSNGSQMFRCPDDPTDIKCAAANHPDTPYPHLIMH